MKFSECNHVLFDGKLKKYKGKKIHLDVRVDAHPIHCKLQNKNAPDYAPKMYSNQ
jgi:hypothetical protein